MFLEVFPMPKRVMTMFLPVGAFFSRLVGNLMIVVMVVATAIGLTQFGALAPRPSGAVEFSAPPGSGVIVRSEVAHLWVPEILVDSALHELPALSAQTHQELKKALERRGQENLWYAITLRGHQVNHGATDISFIRYPYREPENLQELMDVLAAAAGNPPRHPSADYSAAIVHIMPAGMSEREWLAAMKASSLLRAADTRRPIRYCSGWHLARRARPSTYAKLSGSRNDPSHAALPRVAPSSEW
jgi:hypothetical protein